MELRELRVWGFWGYLWVQAGRGKPPCALTLSGPETSSTGLIVGLRVEGLYRGFRVYRAYNKLWQIKA